MGIREKDAQRNGLRFERIAGGIQKTVKRKRVTNERKLLKSIGLLVYDFRLLIFLDGKNRSNP